MIKALLCAQVSRFSKAHNHGAFQLFHIDALRGRAHLTVHGRTCFKQGQGCPYRKNVSIGILIKIRRYVFGAYLTEYSM